MGFVRGPAFYNLTFEGEFAGLEIRLRSMSANEWAAMPAEATLDRPLLAAGNFVGQVDRWNLEYPDGRTVPVTLNDLMNHDIAFIETIVRSWMRDVQPLPHPGTVPAVVVEPPPAEPAVEEPDLSELAGLVQPVPVPA
jgi:hypothetical protein